MDKHNRDLLIRALKGTLDTASRREFDLWVSNADNLRIYENALRIWDDTQRRAAAYTPDRDRLWEQLQSRIGVSGSPQPTERPAPKRRWVPILRTAAAVAAGVVVTLFAVRPDAALTPSPARQEFCAFGDMSDEVDRLTRIVERLLVLTKLDAGGNSLKLEEVDIKMLISQVVKKLTPIANAKDIVIYVDNHQTEFSPILLDYDKMYEAIYNIADNAIKYSPEGGFVHIDLTADNDYLTIKIEDNGPGIPEDERDRIFERFYRLDDSRARDTGGTGLGLAITKEAVLMHNGTIDVANVSDIGSVFTIRLPYKITIGGQNEK